MFALVDRSFATAKFFLGMIGFVLAAVATLLVVHFLSNRRARRWLRYIVRGDIVYLAMFVYKFAIFCMLGVIFLRVSSSALSTTSSSSVVAEGTLA